MFGILVLPERVTRMGAAAQNVAALAAAASAGLLVVEGEEEEGSMVLDCCTMILLRIDSDYPSWGIHLRDNRENECKKKCMLSKV